MALTTLPKVKVHLGISNSAQDDLLNQLITEVESVIQHFTSRKSFDSASRTEYLDGNGKDELFLAHRPLTSVTGVWVDPDGYFGKGTDAFPSDSAWTEGGEFVPQSEEANEQNASMLISLNRIWPEGRGNIKVTYTAGYETIPADLELAANTLVALLRKGRKEGGMLASERLDQYSYQLLSHQNSNLYPEAGTVRSILARYHQ
ncbi:phage head-tail connector protein [Gimesia fumaroli]|uniref:Phage gp6-like head-tail connector protein n=1 Tax=Gimesia fumaroli TaxID=2527976 RepID=A0A518I8U3_9PLAN|nr:phage head-tail connector protein [Gimesia fumaroli]QDV49538.1 Phage gp6-like head-tail connector protein [Gimesia fumaroli]